MTEQLEDLNQLTSESLRMMAVIAEYSLPIVGMHVQRVRGYAYLIGKGLEMSDAEAAQMADACQLHDIGMVTVPLAIVRKTTNLSNDEWEIVRQHPIVGAELLEGGSHPLFSTARSIALTHHERWDGSGYPHGLKGESIPLAGRICGLCDVFDTLTHGRAYKRALSPEEVLLLLQESSESFFDPRLVDIFTLKFAEILDVRDRFRTSEPRFIPEDYG